MANNFQDGHGSQRAVVPVIIMMIMITIIMMMIS
jgi:hypothetical protein